MNTRQPSNRANGTLQTLRRLVLAVVVVGFVGTGVDLLALAHYEDAWQIVPIVLVGVAVVALLTHALTRRPMVALLRVLMVLTIATGALGLALHYQSNREFQLEMDPEIAAWPLFLKSMRAQAPPGLAPGTMALWGVLGLVYTYRLEEHHE
jgi:hypothetical protein